MATKLSLKAKIAIIVAILIAATIILGGASQTAQFAKWQMVILPVSGWCNDTDGGWNLYVKGTCSSGKGGGIDLCISNATLKEWSCTSATGYCISNQTTCSTNKTCNSGRCA
jgi:hypothetical protein